MTNWNFKKNSNLLGNKSTPRKPIVPKRVIPGEMEWPRADPKLLAKFDPRSKVCTMSCGPSKYDPRSDLERKFLCDECYVRVSKE